MKLEKKTIYHVKTKELHDAFMKDAEEQGLKWRHGDKPTKHGCWEMNTDRTCIRIDEFGELNFADEDYYDRNHTDYAHKVYKNTPEVVGCFGGAVCIDAPNFDLAYQMFKNYMTNKQEDFINMNSTKVYTVRVDGDKTTVITPEGKIGVANCHPDDEFDVVEGFRVALEKIEEADRKLTETEKNFLNALVVLGCNELYINDDHELVGYFNDEYVRVEIGEEDFKWLEEYEDYDPQELLDKYA